MPVDAVEDTVQFNQFFQEAREIAALSTVVLFDFDRQIFRGFLQQESRHLPFVFDVLLTLSLFHFEQWRLSDIDVAVARSSWPICR